MNIINYLFVLEKLVTRHGTLINLLSIELKIYKQFFTEAEEK